MRVTAACRTVIIAAVKVIDKARVLSVEDGRAEVALAGGDDPSKCAGCAMDSHCAPRQHRLTVDAPEGVKPGDEVTVEMDLPSPTLAAFLLFMLPLAAAFLAGGTMFALTGSGALSVLGGAAGAAAVYLVLHFAKIGSKMTATILAEGDPSDGGGTGGSREFSG